MRKLNWKKNIPIRESSGCGSSAQKLNDLCATRSLVCIFICTRDLLGRADSTTPSRARKRQQRQHVPSKSVALPAIENRVDGRIESDQDDAGCVYGGVKLLGAK